MGEPLRDCPVALPLRWPLFGFGGGEGEVVEVDAGTVKEVIDRLETRFPGIRNSVCDDTGGLRRFINVYVDGEDVRFLQNLSTPAKDGSEIAIVPAISGGA